MKKILLAILSIVTLLLASSCFNKVTTYKDLSEKEVSKLVKRHITQDMTHEEIFAKLEDLGFKKLWDVSISMGSLHLWPQVAYVMGDVKVITVLDLTLNADYTYIFKHGGLKGYKSEFVTVNGIVRVFVSWEESDAFEISERVAKSRTLQQKVHSKIKVGDDIASAASAAEKLGFVHDTERNESIGYENAYCYRKGKYYLTLYNSTFDETDTVSSISFYYRDPILENETDQD